MWRFPNTKVGLRAPEPDDLELLYRVENREEGFISGETRMPYSRPVLRQFIDQPLQEMWEKSGQMRLMVCVEGGDGAAAGSGLAPAPAGILDFFNFDMYNCRAETGIFITEPYRGKGIGKELIETACRFAENTLHLHQLHADILCSNTLSARLFEECGFTRYALKKDWFFNFNGYEDVLGYQRIL